MRAADADRNRAVEVLQKATTEGYLSLEEFEASLDRVFAARTYSDLDAVLSGVPGAPRPSIEWAPRPPSEERAPAPAGSGAVRRAAWGPGMLGRSPWRVFLTVVFVLFLVNVLVHAWPLPLIVLGLVWWRRSHHGRGWPGYWRRRPAEFV